MELIDISISGIGGGGSANGIGTTVGDAFSGIVTAGNPGIILVKAIIHLLSRCHLCTMVDAAPFNVGIITTLQDVAFAAGGAAAPAITFDTDSDSGFFQAAVNQPGVAGGSQVARFNPSGAVVTGVLTATSYKGDGSALTGIDATSLKDSGGNVKAQAILLVFSNWCSDCNFI